MKRKTYSQRILAAIFLAVTVAAAFLLAPILLLFPDEPSVSLQGPAVMAADTHHYALSTPVALLDGPSVRVERGRISIARSERSDTMSGTELHALLETGTADLVLDRAVLSIGNDADTDDTVPNSSKRPVQQIDLEAAPLARALRSLSFSQLAIRDSTLRLVVPGKAGPARYTFRDADIDLTLNRERTRLTAKGTVDFRGQRLSIDTKLTTPPQPDVKGLALPIQASITSSLLSTEFVGTLLLEPQPRLTADDAQLTISDVPAAARWMGLQWPDQPLVRAFKATGDFDWTQSVIAFQNASFGIDGDTATGTLSLNTRKTRPAIDGTLAFDTLDLTDRVRATSALLQPVLDTAAWIPEVARLSGRFSGLRFLSQIDADLRLSADRAKAGDLVFGRSAATISLRDGRLLADIAELQLTTGGRGSLQLNVDATKPVPTCKIRGSLKGFDVATASELVFDTAVLTGPGDVDVKLVGSGLTARAMLNSLDGSVRVSLPRGAELGLDINTLVSAALTAKSRQDDKARGQTTKPSDTNGNNLAAGFATTPADRLSERRAQMKAAWDAALRGRTRLTSAQAEIHLTDSRVDAKTFSALAPTGAKLDASGTFERDGRGLDVTFWLGMPDSSGKHGEHSKIMRLSGDRIAPEIDIMSQ